MNPNRETQNAIAHEHGLSEGPQTGEEIATASVQVTVGNGQRHPCYLEVGRVMLGRCSLGPGRMFWNFIPEKSHGDTIYKKKRRWEP